MKRIDNGSEEVKILSCAALYLIAITKHLNLSTMLVFLVIKSYLLSILSCLINMKILYAIMSFLSIICCGNYALIILIYAGINSEYLLNH